MINYKNTEQISELLPYKHTYPKYGKSTTDPTYYEPAATRIANMKKSSGVILEGIYDFYSKDDISKFNEKNFAKNIHDVSPDPVYQKGLTREEISQIATAYSKQVEETFDKKQTQSEKKKERIKESLEINKVISDSNSTTQNNDTAE